MLFFLTLSMTFAIMCGSMYYILDVLLKKYWSLYELILSEAEQNEWRRWILTAIQNVFATTWAIISLFEVNDIFSPNNWFESPLEANPYRTYAMALVFGHALFDFWWWAFMSIHFKPHEYLMDWSLVFHHFLILIACVVLPLYDQHTFPIGAQIIHEGSSPFIAIRSLFYLYGTKTKESGWFVLNMSVLAIFFFICHDVVNFFCLKVLYDNFGLLWKQTKFFSLLTISLLLISITLLSALWTFVLWQKTYKAIKKYWFNPYRSQDD